MASPTLRAFVLCVSVASAQIPDDDDPTDCEENYRGTKTYKSGAGCDTVIGSMAAVAGMVMLVIILCACHSLLEWPSDRCLPRLIGSGARRSQYEAAAPATEAAMQRADSVMQTLATRTFGTDVEAADVEAADMKAADVECAICLSNFQNGESLTQLPCGHNFKSVCIRKWLVAARHELTCPLCKQAIIVPSQQVAATPLATSTSDSASERSGAEPSLDVEIEMA